MKNFTYYTPTWVQFGPDSLQQLPALLERFDGHKVLLVYGSNHAEKSGLIQKIETMLEQAQIPCTRLPGVKANPEFELAQKGIALAKKNQCDLVLAAGGGSVIDTAKCIAYGLEYDGDNLWDLWDRKAAAKGAAGVGVILTNAAAGSEMSDSCVMTNHGIKRGYSSPYGRCRFAILDPALTLSLPMKPTMCGCADILMHTLERYLSGGEHMQLTDEISEGLMRTVLDQTKLLQKDLQDEGARAEIMWASSLSHNGLTECGTVKDFSCHTLGHELSGKYDVAHGASLTAVFGSWAMYVFQSDLDRFAKFARTVLDIDIENDHATAFMGIQKLVSIFKSMGLPTSLPELGLQLDDADLKELARNAAISCGGKKGTAKVLTEEDFYTIYKAANTAVDPKVI